jgi:hypothetical protein
LPKYWYYEIGKKVVINDTARDLITHIGKQGQIIHLHEGILFDYDVLLDTNEIVRVRDTEIVIVKKGEKDEYK